MNAHLAEYRPCRIAACASCLLISLLQQLALSVAAGALGGDVLGPKARTVSRVMILPPMMYQGSLPKIALTPCTKSLLQKCQKQFVCCGVRGTTSVSYLESKLVSVVQYVLHHPQVPCRKSSTFLCSCLIMRNGRQPPHQRPRNQIEHSVGNGDPVHSFPQIDNYPDNPQHPRIINEMREVLRTERKSEKRVVFSKEALLVTRQDNLPSPQGVIRRSYTRA